MIAAYGKAIERDLAHFYPGTDLGTEWRARRWRKLLNLIEGLPRNSAYVEAVSQDDVLADMLADKPDPPSRGPRISEYSPDSERLDAIFDRLGEVVRAIASMGGAKVNAFPPSPRPVTALQRARRRRREARHRSLVARLLPPKRT